MSEESSGIKMVSRFAFIGLLAMYQLQFGEMFGKQIASGTVWDGTRDLLLAMKSFQQNKIFFLFL